MFRLSIAIVCICIGVGLLGILGNLVPVLSDAEEDLGLHLLYLLRGPAKPPADVVVVAIDRESARALHLPATPYKWPRRLHARLLENLAARQVALVAFDLIFHEPQEADNDTVFAAAMRKAGNVVLTQTIDRQTMPLNDRMGVQAAQVTIDKLISAIPVLASAALGQAPFPLPKVPVKLSQYWRFSPGSGDVPTLPVVALHAFDMQAFDEFVGLLKRVDPSGAAALGTSVYGQPAARSMIETIRPLYALFNKEPALAGRMTTELMHNTDPPLSIETIGRIRSFIALYESGRSRFLNLYGPPGTIQTISYHRLLGHDDTGAPAVALPSLKGKAVFVGQTESDWFKANDGFYTPFTEKSGMDLSGVEIAATAFANLLEGKAVYPLGAPAQIGVLLVWGIAMALLSCRLSNQRAAVALVAFGGIYLWAAQYQFKTQGLWYPLVIPVLLQTPAAFIAGLVWKYRRANAERLNIRKAFGYYLPDEVVERLAANFKDLHTGGKVLFSICLFTDAESYTTLSETMDPQRLTELMNAYYEVIFKPIKAHKGLVLQVVGDSVLAIWTAPQPRGDLKTAACRAAVEITEALQDFNQQVEPNVLPTRIGIHAGEILLGNIGAMDHFEYRPVGDIVNTASRLEGLNKFLGTRMLVSEDAVGPDDSLLTRSVGSFVFKGKSRPVEVRELFSQNGISQELQAASCRIFARGLEAFTHRNWAEAEKTFSHVLKIDENDGPSKFYLNLCREFRQTPPDEQWNGAVPLTDK